MYRIDDNQNVSTLPADPTDNVGTPGFFTGGNPGASPAVPPTRVRYWWLNMIQEELCALVLAAGLTLTKGNLGQVLQAVGIIPQGRRLSGRQILANTAYTWSQGTRLIKVTMQAAGGAGAGTEAVPTGSISVGSGGASGGYATAWFATADLVAPVAITLGAAGFGGDGVGGNAAASSFGSYMIVPGGGGGLVTETPNTTTFAVVGQGLPGAAPTVTGNIAGDESVAFTGQPGLVGLIFSGAGESGQGAASRLGSGGNNTAGGAGAAPSGYGAGGSGAAVQSGGAAQAGGSGGPAYCYIEEWS